MGIQCNWGVPFIVFMVGVQPSLGYPDPRFSFFIRAREKNEGLGDRLHSFCAIGMLTINPQHLLDLHVQTSQEFHLQQTGLQPSIQRVKAQSRARLSAYRCTAKLQQQY